MHRLALLFSSGLGLGYLPWASGTFGTCWGVLLFYLCRNLNVPVFILGIILLTLLSLWMISKAEKSLGSHDSSIIVIDEVLGYLVAVVAIPYTFWNAAIAFGLFRLFDIWKPFPIRRIDRDGKGAWGVILDDIVAGIFANLCLRLILFFWSGI